MSVVEKVKHFIGNDSTHDKKRYECHDCGTEFESFKTEDRAACQECMCSDVEVVGTVDR